MYSIDFKKLAIRLYKKYNNYRKVTNILKISLSTLHSWIHNGIKRSKRIFYKKWFHNVYKFIKEYVDNNPFISLFDISNEILKSLKIKISQKTISRYLKKLRIVKKKAKHHCREFFYNNKVPAFKDKLTSKINEVVYSVDECYFSEKVNPLYGYCEKGKTLATTLLPKGWKQRSLLMIINSEGEKHYEIINGTVNKDNFLTFLKPFKGKNILLDNVAFHKSCKTENFIYTPPYCPQYNPIEYCFSKIKHTFRKFKLLNNPFDDLLQEAINSLTPENIINSFQHVYNEVK